MLCLRMSCFVRGLKAIICDGSGRGKSSLASFSSSSRLTGSELIAADVGCRSELVTRGSYNSD